MTAAGWLGRARAVREPYQHSPHGTCGNCLVGQAVGPPPGPTIGDRWQAHRWASHNCSRPPLWAGPGGGGGLGDSLAQVQVLSLGCTS